MVSTAALAMVLSACGGADNGSATRADPSGEPVVQARTAVASAPGPGEPGPGEPGSAVPRNATLREEPSKLDTGSGAPPVEVLWFVGDSIAGQLQEATRYLSRLRGGPEVRYMLNAGPAFSPDWPAPFAEVGRDAGRSALVLSIGVWLAVPPQQALAHIDGKSEEVLRREIERFLEPMASGGFVRTPTMLLLADLDDPVADKKLQVANSMLAQEAVAQGMRLLLTLRGTHPLGEATTVTLEDTTYPTRAMADPTHYCPAAALAMADALLEDLGASGPAPTSDDVKALVAAAADTPYFEIAGC